MTALRVGNPDRQYSAIAREDPTCIYLVVNGSLTTPDGEPMGAGKIASQAFQAALWLLTDPGVPGDVAQRVRDWQAEGARTVTRVAKTPAAFARVLDEVPGLVLADEGLTEVDRGALTVFCSWPVRRSQAPKILSHKRIPLL